MEPSRGSVNALNVICVRMKLSRTISGHPDVRGWSVGEIEEGDSGEDDEDEQEFRAEIEFSEEDECTEE